MTKQVYCHALWSFTCWTPNQYWHWTLPVHDKFGQFLRLIKLQQKPDLFGLQILFLSWQGSIIPRSYHFLIMLKNVSPKYLFLIAHCSWESTKDSGFPVSSQSFEKKKKSARVLLDLHGRFAPYFKLTLSYLTQSCNIIPILRINFMQVELELY